MQDNPDGHRVALNNCSNDPSGNWFFAELLRMELNGTLRTVQNGNNQVFNIVEHQVGSNETPLKGVLYVLVYGDDILFTGKERFSSRCLEDYLDWFLKKDGNILEQDRDLILKTTQPDYDRLRANSANIKLAPFEEDYLAQQVISGAQARGILDKLGLTRQGIHTLTDDKKIEMNITLKFKDGRKNRDIPIGNIENMLRNIDDVQDVTYKGPDGTIKGLGTRLEGKQDIRSAGSFYDLTDARNKLLIQFDDWDKQGYMSNNI